MDKCDCRLTYAFLRTRFGSLDNGETQMSRDIMADVERMKRGESSKQVLWDEGVPFFVIEAIAAMADGMPEVFARAIMQGHSREAVEKRAVDILNRD